MKRFSPGVDAIYVFKDLYPRRKLPKRVTVNGSEVDTTGPLSDLIQARYAQEMTFKGETKLFSLDLHTQHDIIFAWTSIVGHRAIEHLGENGDECIGLLKPGPLVSTYLNIASIYPDKITTPWGTVTSPPDYNLLWDTIHLLEHPTSTIDHPPFSGGIIVEDPGHVFHHIPDPQWFE